KMSAVPFHMWTPDVYEGAPTPVTAFFASAVKMAAVAITLRVILTAFSGIPAEWRQLVIFISILSMVLGAFAAIGQSNIKRLMAYSAIGHIGFALVGLAAGGEAGVSGVIAYMAIYLVMTLGTFAGILSMRVNGKSVENISDLSGLARTDGTMAFFLAMMMFSLAGVPPLAGFFAKWYVFNAAIQSGLYTLAVIGVLSSAVAAFYYLRVVKVMYFDEPAPAFDRTAAAPRVVLAATGVMVLALFVYPGLFMETARAAASSLF
ncbi:MAG TPA: NADH-quinone oxidoreductase subunit N, partial [Methylocella sp.]|nr:NADH-quinone oxidoreductase subunit N [Methylocella sp.]